MKSKIPSYKSTFYKFIKPDDAAPATINGVYEYKNVIKPLSFFSINEIYVSKYIVNIPNYFLYFIPILKSTTITLPTLAQQEQTQKLLIYTRDLDSDNNFYQMFNNLGKGSGCNEVVGQVVTPEDITLTKGSNNIGKSSSNSKKGIIRIIDSYKYLLHIIHILNTYQIVHLNIIPNNILFNSDNNPILSNFTNSFHFPSLNEERKSNLFKSYIPKNQNQNQSNIFYTQPLEVYVISFLENQSNNSSLSLSNIELLCSNFTTLSFSSLSIFSETYIKEYKEQAVFSLRCYINKPKEYVVNELLKNSSTWDNYSLSMLYLHLLNFHFVGAGENHMNNKFIISFSQILMNNIHAEASYRCSPSQTLELFEEALYSIDARTIASIA
uniref:Protein kinase domain-containing protein n=1 Tax=viral metagenome TaxID=1070528 RepID=A0A6C0EWU4_9ZZZZ